MTPDQLRECPIDQCAENTDREIYRGPDDGCGDYYSDSLHITQEGALGIDCGGYVIVKPIRTWHGLSKAHAAALEEIDLLKDGESLMMRNAQKWKERAEQAERRAERLKFHAEAMAARIEWYAEEGWVNGDIPEARAYRAEFKEE